MYEQANFWQQEGYVGQQLLQSEGNWEVYRAQRLSDGLLVVVKVVDLQNCSDEERTLITRIYEALAEIDCKNIIKVHRIWPVQEPGLHSPVLCVEAEDYPSETLLDLLTRSINQDTSIDEHTIVSIARGITYGLAHLHSRLASAEPLVYGKLALNRVILKEGQYKLLDSSDIRPYCEQREAIDSKRDNAQIGTEAHDIWCLGHIILQLCNLQLSEQDADVSQDSASITPKYPEWVLRLVRKCMSPNAQTRPSAADIVLYIQRHDNTNVTTYNTATPTADNNKRIRFGVQYTKCTSGNMVQLMPRTGMDVDTSTTLMAAAEAGDLEQVEANIDQVGMVDWQGTALIKAARRGHVACVSALLSELGIQSRRGWTALQDAAYSGQKRCIPLLMLEACIQRPDGQTALMGAAANGHEACVKLLCHKEMRMTTTAGRTALMYAAEQNHSQCVEVLLGEACMCDIMGTTALMLASLEGNVNCVRLLAPYEAILSNKEGKTALDLVEEKLLKCKGTNASSLQRCLHILLAGRDVCANDVQEGQPKFNG